MPSINIKNDPSTLLRLNELFVNLELIENTSSDSGLEINSSFTTTLSVTALAEWLNKKSIHITNLDSYLQTICFPKGVEDISNLSVDKT